MMTELQDIRIESDESEEFISRLERSFGISFDQMEISNGMTLMNLLDNITAVLNRTPVNECTSQKIFFRLRELVAREFGYDRSRFTPSSKIKDVFPSSTRKKQIEVVAKHLQINMNYFQAPGWMLLLVVLTLLGSFIYLLINAGAGLVGIIASILLMAISGKFLNELPFDNIGQLVQRITTDNLVLLQGNENKINLNEVKSVLISIIKDLHGLEDHEISFDQRIVFA